MAQTEAAYKKKIADLHTQLEAEVKKLETAREKREQEERSAKLLREEQATLGNTVNDLKHEVENLGKLIQEKRDQGTAVITELEDQTAKRRLELAAAEFSIGQLNGHIERRQAKAKELVLINDEHSKAIARLASTLTEASDQEELNAQARQERERLISEARELDERVHVREQQIEGREQALRDSQETIEFYRNRIVAYCVEKGLPVPNFTDG